MSVTRCDSNHGGEVQERVSSGVCDVRITAPLAYVTDVTISVTGEAVRDSTTFLQHVSDSRMHTCTHCEVSVGCNEQRNHLFKPLETVVLALASRHD